MAGYSIVTFAFNEEEHLAQTLDSIRAATDDALVKVTVVANGCTDNTAEVARQAMQAWEVPHQVIELALGDKCNAWNTYVYDHLPEADVHFFVDSDVTFSDRAFPQLYGQLAQSPGMNAVTGLPCSGRNAPQYLELATQYSCLFGNLYGLTHEFLQRLKEQGIRLPVGLSWIDAQITKLVNDNLEYAKDDYRGRVTFVVGVGYRFESLKPWKPDHIRLYINRICRYKAGQLQEPYLDALPFVDWPETMEPINRTILEKGLSLRSLGKLAPLRARIARRLGKKLASPSGAPS